MSVPKSERDRIRVAAAQFATGVDVGENLASCLRVIDEAARGAADLVVLPEFSNHLSWYEDKAHCFRVSVPIGGEFLSAIAARARQHAMHVVVNCTVQRRGFATCTSLLFGPDGALLASRDKQVLMGHENDFLEPATDAGPVVSTPLGRLGLYACMDGVICEPARSLALRGAQILCNSLNSFAPDEAALHVPVRAAENRAFVVAANKVGPLIPAPLIDAASAATNIPKRFLYGAGGSQIVAPDGRVLAAAPESGEAVVFADIDPRAADDKRRDGTDLFAARRPEIYRPLVEPPPPARARLAAAQLEVATFSPREEGEAAIAETADAVASLAASGVKLIVLPELFCFARALVEEGRQGAARSALAVMTIARALALAGGGAYVVTSIVEREPAAHVGVVIGSEGIVGRQPQIHRTERHASWARAALGVMAPPVDLGWGRVGLVVGDDALFPETSRVHAIRGAEVLAIPFQAREAWETRLGLVERAAENRVCVVAATRPSEAGTSLVATLWEDFTVMTPWKSREFDGQITAPIVTRAGAEPGALRATIHPLHAQNKLVSRRTHLTESRPWKLSAAIAGGGAA